MNFNNFTTKSQEVVQQAVNLAQAKGQQVIETPHILKAAMMKGEDVVQFLFGKMGIYSSNVMSVVDKIVDSYPRVTGGEPYLSRESNEVFQKAMTYPARQTNLLLEYISGLAM